MMRTTLTIEDGLANELKRRAIEAGKPFKQVVNEALLAGLQGPITPRLKPYRLKPVSLGAPSAGIDLVKALQLADGLEDDAIRAKLEQRK
jgi:hypothetical protein